MLRGHRSIVFALVGIALLAASPPPKNAAQAEQTASEQPVGEQRPRSVATAPEPPVTPSPDPGCEDGRDNRKSDLCAQWKAADAAFSSAEAAREQVLVGWIALVLGAATMVAAIAAAAYARRAAVATEETVGIAREASEGAGEALAIATRNADAAAEQVKIAGETAKHQLRAYIGVKSVKLEWSSPNMASTQHSVSIVMQNFGQTPARVHSFFWITTNEAQTTFTAPEHVAPREYLAPGATRTITRRLKTDIEESRALRGGQARLKAVLRFEYEDIFGASYGHSISWVSVADDYMNKHMERQDEQLATHRDGPEAEA